MARQNINNTPADSGLGDSLKLAFDKVNAMTLELYAADSTFADEIDLINVTIAKVNDGSLLNHTHTIAQIQGLQSTLNSKISASTYIGDMMAINASIQAINNALNDIVVILNTKVEEAPFSGITYGRNNGAWVEISGGGTTSGDYLPLSGGTMFDNAIIQFNNNSQLKEGNYDFGGQGGISQICAVGYENNWQSGINHIFDNNGFIRESSHCFDIIPDSSFDSTLRFKVDSRWVLDNGDIYICSDASVGAAVWSLYGNLTSVGLSMPSAFTVSNSPITSAGTISVTATGTTNEFIKGDGTLGTTVTRTSELINDGDNGSTHFISLQDLPSNLILYATTAASDISGYSKLVTSITDPSYNTGD